MLKLLTVLALAVTAFAWVDDEGRDSAIEIVSGSGPGGGDAITLTIIDTFQLDPSVQMLGMDFDDPDNDLLFMDNEADLIRAVEPGTGNPSWTEDVLVSGTFGVCHDAQSPYGLYINSWIMGDIFYLDPSDTWVNAYTNPAGIYGRGMDFEDTGYIWEAASIPPSTIGFYRIDAGTGAGVLHEITPGGPMDQLSGVTFVPYAPHAILVVTTYDYPDWFFYQYDGSGMVYIGTAVPTVAGFEGSRGLAYSNLTDTIYWSYKTTGDTRWIAEVEFTVSALEQDTWGGIKSQF